MNVFTLFAHPDDETLAAGGAIYEFSKRGHSIHCLTPFTGATSRDSAGRSAVTKLREDCKSALKILGVQSVVFADFPDNRGDSFPRLQLFKWVEQEIADRDPGLIITHHWRCTNIDHQRCYEAAVIATRPSPTCHVDIWCGEIPSSTGYLKPTMWEPNTYVSISREALDAKIAALRAYESEVRESPHPRSPEVIESLARVRGSESGFEFGEAFIGQRLLIN